MRTPARCLCGSCESHSECCAPHCHPPRRCSSRAFSAPAEPSQRSHHLNQPKPRRAAAAGADDADQGHPANRVPDLQGQDHPDHPAFPATGHRVLPDRDHRAHQVLPAVDHPAPQAPDFRDRPGHPEAAVRKSRLPAQLLRRPIRRVRTGVVFSCRGFVTHPPSGCIIPLHGANGLPPAAFVASWLPNPIEDTA